jgi:hypothetical protein
MSEPDGIVGLACFFGTSRLFRAKPVRQDKGDHDEDRTERDADGFTGDQPSISAG